MKKVIVPNRWDLEETAYTPLPSSVDRFRGERKAVVVYLPAQLFGAYEFGNLVRWGPVSSGSRRRRTPPGLYALNWNARVRISSEDEHWVMPWYFNFDSRRGLGFHEYTLPGRPASHGCVRMLAGDAKWLFGWGEGWTLAPDRQVLRPGTPVLIVGEYDFGSMPPWLEPEWWARELTLPAPGMAGLK